MCATCGCGDEHEEEHVRGGHAHDHELAHDHDVARAHEDGRTVRFERALLEKNARFAAQNRHRFAHGRLVVLNLLGAPGSGKTSLLEATLRRLGRELPLAVIEGDQATDRDAQRITGAGGRAVQVNTGPGCHLDAEVVGSAVRDIAPREGSVVFVENVGNLVCPALFDLGERAKIVVVSVTEGEDKPLKYPHVFRAAERLVLTKVDLIPHVAFDEAALVAAARAIHPGIAILPLSSATGAGLDAWCDYVRSEVARLPRADVTNAPRLP